MAATKRSVCYFLTHKMMPALFPFRTGQTMMTSWGGGGGQFRLVIVSCVFVVQFK